MKRKRGSGLLWYSAFQLLVLVIFYFPWLSGTASYFFRDLTHYIEPFACFTGQALARLELPLWNPWCYCGMPQMSVSVQGIFYPPTWLFAFLPFNSALAASMILHQSLCGIGGFLLVSSFGWGALPATICGAILAMSGYAFSFTSIFSLVESAAWCPLALWAIAGIGRKEPYSPDEERARPADERQMSAACLLAAFIIAMHIMAGHPELGLVEFALLGGYIFLAAANGWRDRERHWKVVLAWRLKAITLGVLLAMPAILPAFEWLGLSRRAAGIDPREALILSANWYDFLSLVLGQPLGDLQLRWAEFRPLVMNGQLLPYLSSAFVGPVVLTSALWGLFDRTFKERWLAFILIPVAFLLAAGENAPLSPLILHHLPSFIRFPIKLLFFAVFGLAVLSARGLFACFNKNANTAISLSFWGLFALAAGCLLSGMPLLDWLLGFPALPPLQQALLRKAQSPLAWWSMAAAASGAAISICAYISQKQAGKQLWMSYLLLSATVASLLYYAISFCRTAAPGDYFEKPSFAADQLKHLQQKDPRGGGARILGLYLEHFTVPETYLSKDPRQATVETYQYSRQVLRTNTNIDFRQASSFGFEGTCTGDYYFFLLNAYGKSSQAYGIEPGKARDGALARTCQATATSWVLTQVFRFGKDPASLEPVPVLDERYFQPAFESAQMNLRIYRVLSELPRAYFSDCWQFVDNRNQALEKMFDPEISGFDPAKTTLLEPAGTSGRQCSMVPSVSGLSSDNKVVIEKESLNMVALSVESKNPGFLILTDQYYPGWVAEVDGKETEIFPANGFGRAVALSPGSHSVCFSYRPKSLLAGFCLSAAALFWMIYLFAAKKRKS